MTLQQLNKLLKKEYYLTNFVLIETEDGKKITIVVERCHGSRMRATDASRVLNKQFEKKGIRFGSKQVDKIYPIK